MEIIVKFQGTQIARQSIIPIKDFANANVILTAVEKTLKQLNIPQDEWKLPS